jgi:glutaredoxin
VTAQSATLFIASTCPHCPAVMQALTTLLKTGKLARLEIFNIELNADKAEQYGVRAVPWVQLGPFELTGLRTQAELLQWIERSNDPTAMAAYFAEQIISAEMDKVLTTVKNNPPLFNSLLQLMGDDTTSLSVRIGIGALMEDLATGDLINQYLDDLGAYTTHANAVVRNDACHYLGLSRNPAAEKFIRPLLNDNDAEVRETAAEALQEITKT